MPDGQPLSLGCQPVFNVLFTYQPFTLPMFVSWFNLQYPEHRERFWRTARQHRFRRQGDDAGLA